MGAEMDKPRPDYIPGPARLMLARFGEEVFHAVGIAFLVGSALDRKDYRDVDVRVILQDDVFDRLAALTDIARGRQSSFNLAFSVLGERMTGLPVDFQIQRSSESNREFTGVRQALFVGRAAEAKATPCPDCKGSGVRVKYHGGSLADPNVIGLAMESSPCWCQAAEAKEAKP